MALFQKSVLNKYLKTLDDKKVKAAYQKFTDFFHNPTIIQNIREDKEEQFQYGFLQKLFDEILDYTINPNIDFNLSTEFKNLRGAKKADGAILKDGKAVGVIELKSTKTKELSKITDQAFGYKNNHPTCVYVITSNFEKLRFYINDAVDYLDFDLFTLKEEDFKLLYLCLQKDNILSDLPQRIKRDSTLQEENITKKLYKDYSAFKNALFDDLVKNNTQYSKLTLFKKSQKLIDRFLFIFFAEDKGLLPPNSISKIVKSYEALEDLDNYKPLYEVFQQYFGYINSGRPARKGKAEIFAFNGGLFAPDEMLDGLKITDNILMNHTLLLSGYDFESEVDVNILGHIFEHSLNEIDEITAELEGQPIDKSKTKRKKDGVFYTPKYITKYIVDNTVGKLCEAYKEKVNLQEDDYRPNRNKTTKKNLLADLEAYRAYLLELTICDPACGSGAFLNQALDFLITEHRYIDELQTRLLGGSIVLSDITNDILERNIYGVDINDESVDIARLSLWLRTAQKGRALTTLNDNIKCGNSVVDDPEYAGEKAFKWEEEFPEVFEKGGFDVIVGNPPYVRQELIKKFSKYLEETFSSYSGKADLFVYFFENGNRLLKENGILSFICSGKFLEANYGIPLLNYLVDNSQLLEVINFQDLEVFKGISAYPMILTFQKKIRQVYDFKFVDVTNLEFTDLPSVMNKLEFESINIIDFKSNEFQFINKRVSSLLKHIRTGSSSLGELKILPLVGVKTGYNDGFTISKQDGEFSKGYAFGRDIKRYKPIKSNNSIIFPYSLNNAGMYDLVKEDLLSKEIIEQLLVNREKLEKRAVIKEGLVSGNKIWYEYQQIKKNLNFDSEYIVYPNVSLGNNFTLSKGKVIDMTGFILPTNDKGLLAVLNSKLVKFLMEIWSISRRGGYLEYKVQYLNKLPIKEFNQSDKQNVITLVKNILEYSEQLQTLLGKFQRLLQRKFNLEKLPKNLQNWHTLTFAEFVKELKKKKVKLSLSEEAEWEDYFEAEKAKAQTIQAEIDKTDKEIDRMVYELYGLSEEEIGIVENA